MEYLEMLDELRDIAEVEIVSAGAVWKIILILNNDIVIRVDESLESLIGTAYNDYYLSRSHK